MALSVDNFINQYPEFKDTDRDLISAKLDIALGYFEPDRVTPDADRLHGLKTASLLASAPQGYDNRLADPNQLSPYEVQFRELANKHSAGPHVENRVARYQAMFGIRPILR